jgi:16S rRNA (guanine(1405)-N(7))-methyltransferase
MKKDILRKVKDHKKYRSISDSVVEKEIEEVLRVDSKMGDKELVKEVRKILHRLYSSYQTGKKGKRDKYLERLKILVSDKNKDGEEFDALVSEMLSITLSTKERLEDYDEIYSKIFSITGKPKRIVDLGCGMNPLSFPLMGLSKLEYFGYDIDIDDIRFLNEYFKVMAGSGLKGKAEVLDVRDLIKIGKIPKCDVVFMFKLVDLIDSGKNKVSEELIAGLLGKAKWVVVSFATRTLTRKSMRLGERRGFEKMLERVGLKWERFSTGNEVFYVVGGELITGRKV